LNVPAFLNTRPKAAPGASTPESHTPLIDVVVWLTVPAFVHLTFVPFAMVIALGLKAKLMILTALTEVAVSREACPLGDRSDAILGTASDPTSVATSSVIPILIGALRIRLPFILRLRIEHPMPDTRPPKYTLPDIRAATRFGCLRRKDPLETAKDILSTVGLITPEMRRIVEEQRLGFAATICEDGTANLSPKGTVTVLDDEHLMFADLASPQTVKNLRTNTSIEINVVDPVIRKGFRFKGRGIVVDPGERFDQLLESSFTSGARAVRDATARIRHIVVIEVERALPVVSPAYDEDVTEAEVSARWERYFQELWVARRRS
jgi:predicted pyridoxine 5'-phosphate oxidase superfamily flavin-nucleotide-binding protein